VAFPKDTNPGFYDIQPLLFFTPSKQERKKALTSTLKKLHHYIQSHHTQLKKTNHAHHKNQRNSYSREYTHTVKMIRRLEN
jgi:hypothetical protein